MKDATQDTHSFSQTAGTAFPQNQGGVVAYHPLAREAGETILAAGGNAADAFVAAAIAQNVVGEGGSSLAGPMSAMVYWSDDQKPGAPSVVCLDADFNTPLDPEHRYKRGARHQGTAMLVPGMPLGLWELAAKYGSKKFSELAAPSIDHAENGVPVTRAMDLLFRVQKKVLRRSDYAHRTFFRDGKLLVTGERFRQPQVATFLRRLSEEGPDYVYRGSWGERFLDVVRATRGSLTKADLEQYAVHWSSPWSTSYRGHTVFATSGASIGGFWDLLALKVWEQAHVPSGSPAWYDPEVLELMIRTARHCWSEPYLLQPDAFADRGFIQSRLTAEYAATIWERVRKREPPQPFGAGGSHSYSIIAHDRHGNIVSGTITIESDNWGDGHFIDGVPLPHAGRVPWNTRPGLRRISVLTSQIAFKGDRPRFVVDTIANSLVEAAFQLLVNLIDHGLPLEDAVTVPRFGTFAPARAWKWRRVPIHLDRNWLDPTIPKKIVAELKRRGIRVVQRGALDTGLGSVVSISPETRTGINVPIPFLSRPYAT